MKKLARKVLVGGVAVGGGAPVSIQSMTNTDTRDVDATAAQILRLEEAGCEIVRASVYDMDCARAIGPIKQRIHIPLVADIHFDYKLALAAIENGVDKLRINPGNIGSAAHVREVTAAAKEHGVPIRIGVNGGSLHKDLLKKYGGPTPEALVESALSHVALLEAEGFYDTVISIKSSDVVTTVAANRLLSEKVDYPLHLGVTEAGAGEQALIKAAAGLGTLLLSGIGDTVRCSITGDPVEEPRAAMNILRAIGLRKEGVEVVSCPTCGRCRVDLAAIVEQVKSALPETKIPLKLAVMGCVVNGPGEAREAELGIAFAPGGCMVFEKGRLLSSYTEWETGIRRLIDEANALLLKKESEARP